MMTNAQAALLAAVQMSHDPAVIEEYTRQAKKLLDELDNDERRKASEMTLTHDPWR